MQDDSKIFDMCTWVNGGTISKMRNFGWQQCCDYKFGTIHFELGTPFSYPSENAK